MALAQRADVTFVGVGQMSNDAPLLADGFVSRDELDEMQAAGAVGEVAGWVFDSNGQYLDVGTNRRTGPPWICDKGCPFIPHTIIVCGSIDLLSGLPRLIARFSGSPDRCGSAP